MTDTLHIYSQYAHHDNAYIAGDKGALIRLRDLIDLAIASDVEGMNFFTNDGEGFTTYVYCLPTETMDKLSTPYTAEYAQDYRQFYPWNVKL
ncbi:hypothetical protein SCRM01_199 [Synechococcus phage S-CRM01]|uniref:hypothetical protein n=1 Tax=Synechococcus phage S-CRM01 TaxID=1026955 RepID=UPI000209E418|nr:hypothetical protein SCRM01_199 [Synechococcus phage S-CRM01]AEC53145.1 hypothetical protein SCRM01_199 [Synechococcus phage S-CRM01]